MGLLDTLIGGESEENVKEDEGDGIMAGAAEGFKQYALSLAKPSQEQMAQHQALLSEMAARENAEKQKDYASPMPF